MVVDFIFRLMVFWCAGRFMDELKIQTLSSSGMFVILTAVTIIIVWNQG